jgi:nucleoside-diphosphate-sugar epimerase
MNANKTVIVAGASGVFGRHVTRALREGGYQVLGLGRGEGNEIRADLTDRFGLLGAVRGVRAGTVVHAATALRKPPLAHKDMYRTDDLRVAGTANLVAAAAAVGAERFVGENIVFGYGYRDFGEHVLTEADPFGVGDPDKRFVRHLDAMREKEELPKAAGLAAISLRYGLFYGAGATETLVDLLRRRKIPTFDDHGHALPWINVADAAAALLAAVEHGRAGEAYNVVDESVLGMGGMLRATAAAFGTPKPMSVPVWLTAVMPYVHRIAEISLRVSSEKARRELGWSPAYSTVEDGLQALTP